MFNYSDKNAQQTSVQEKFIIVYDKLTKPVAISLRNDLKKYTCVIWNEKEYFANEVRLTNHNFLILLNENVVKKNLANPNLKPIAYIKGMNMIVEGNTVGFKFNSETSPKQLNNILKENWKKYLSGVMAPILLVGGIAGAALMTTLLLMSDKKKIKLKLFFDAIDKFKSTSLENFLNGRLV